MTLVEVKELTSLPDGTYAGKQTGNEYKFTVNGTTYIGKSLQGVRGINIPVTVTIKNGKTKSSLEQ